MSGAKGMEAKQSAADAEWTIEELYRTKCRDVPSAAGVYWVRVPDGMTVRFIEPKDTSFYSKKDLENKYARCKEKDILYIGKATGRRGLSQRLRQYVKHGHGEGNNHCGGRAIWQIENADELVVTYEICEDATARERKEIEAYKVRNGCFPLANWRK